MPRHPSSDGTGWSDPVLGGDDVRVGVFMLLCVVYRGIRGGDESEDEEGRRAFTRRRGTGEMFVFCL